MAKKIHADILLCEQGLAQTQDEARRLIMAGLVYIRHPKHMERVDKPGTKFSADAPLVVQGRERFVSRGAYKLLTAMEYFSLNVAGCVALDAGASTGGFTDCLLQHGAARVYAVDVGKHQLHERLQADPRVVNLEGVNLRTAPVDLIPEPVDILVADVSFISLTSILPPCLRWLRPGALVAALIKPQFEVGVNETERGVVRDESVRQAAVEKVLAFARDSLCLDHVGIVPSAIKGPKGNQEYMSVWRYTGGKGETDERFSTEEPELSAGGACPAAKA